MFKLRTIGLSMLGVTLLGFGQAALGQAQGNFTYNEQTLTTLFDALLKKGGKDTYIEKRIADERSKIRITAEKEVKSLVEPTESGTQTVDTTNPTKAIDRQRSVVQLLDDNLKDRNADLDLLIEEENQYYLNPLFDSTASDSLRLTKTHAELLAKKTILEERVDALESGRRLQEDRLSNLAKTQWFEQFTALFGFFRYLLIVFGAVMLDRLIRKRLVRRFEEKGRRYIVAKFISGGIYTVAAFWLLSKLFTDHPNAVASLAIVGAGIAVALQDVVKDFMGWIIILQRHLYTVGDRAAIGHFTGDVIDIGPLRTTMLEISVNGAFNAHERTGKILYLPNSLVLRESVLNYNTTSDFMSVELQVTITYGSNWRKAEQILTEILTKQTSAFAEQARKQQRKRTALFYTMWEVGEPEIHVDLANNGVQFTLKFIVPIGKRRVVVTELSREILEKFNADREVELAYNTIQIVGGKEVS